MRASVFPEIAPDVLALLVTDLSGEVTMWRTARRVASLPDRDAVVVWAWQVARPKGSCGGVPWPLPPIPAPAPPAPAPIGRYAIGTQPRSGYHRGRSSQSEVRSR